VAKLVRGYAGVKSVGKDAQYLYKIAPVVDL